jgi:FKBP-type peptidyl-prolyl cis-trans isomerase 2
MKQAAKGNTVRVHYEGRLKDGTLFDSSANREPLQFTIGEREVIHGFEQGIVDMIAGQSKTINVPSDEAFGPYRRDLLMKLPRENIDVQKLDLKIGDQIKVEQSEDEPLITTIRDIDDSEITLDANNPLAGEELTFDIKLVEIL